MKRAYFRFYAELGDFLPRERRGVAFAHEFQGGPSVKDVIESLGVPHPEVDLVLADGESVGFGWILRDGARVSVYPVFESFDVTPLARVRPAPLREVRSVVDGHLGRLARSLRMLGFDTRWRRDLGDEELARVSAAEHRILLTRDAGLLKRRIVTHGYRVRSGDPRRQLSEVVQRLDLLGSSAPFRRCLRCNDRLEDVLAEDVAAQLPPRVRERHAAFRRCPACRRLYWPGTHQQRMERLVSELRAERARAAPRVARYGRAMRIALAADHAGYALKERLAEHLRARGHDVLDLGAHDASPSDYPDHALAAGRAVLEGRAERAILVCGSGVGVAAAANKLPGIRAGMCHDHYSAHQAVEHDDMNVLALGARVVGEALAIELVDAFLAARFTGEERHVRRLAKLRALEAGLAVPGEAPGR